MLAARPICGCAPHLLAPPCLPACLPGHHAPGTPASKRLRSGPHSNVLLYLTGHGGDEFLKFHDQVRQLSSLQAWPSAQGRAGLGGQGPAQDPVPALREQQQQCRPDLLSGFPCEPVWLPCPFFTNSSSLSYPPQEELLASDVAAALQAMHAGGRYGQLLLVADTCQASTLYGRIAAPNVLAMASSKLGECGNSAAEGLLGNAGLPAEPLLLLHCSRSCVPAAPTRCSFPAAPTPASLLPAHPSILHPSMHP